MAVSVGCVNAERYVVGVRADASDVTVVLGGTVATRGGSGRGGGEEGRGEGEKDEEMGGHHGCWLRNGNRGDDYKWGEDWMNNRRTTRLASTL